MRSRLPFAFGAITIFVLSGLPADAQTPAVVPLEISLGDGRMMEACLQHLAEESPAKREARVVSNIEFVRRIHPDLDETELRESAEMMLDERCQLPKYPLPPARKEKVGDDWVVHVGEHSIIHDLYLNRPSASTPIHLVFFGIPFGLDAGYEIKDAMVAAGWETACGGDHQTTLYDENHGGLDQFISNRYHMQPADQNCAYERRHLKIWGSTTGDTHPGVTYGGYGLGSAHKDLSNWAGQHTDGVLYDQTRDDWVGFDLIDSGRVDSWFYVNAGNTNPNSAQGANDGQVLYLHMKYPARPCRDDSIVRVYADVGYLGTCLAFDSDDSALANDGMGLRISSVKVASGYRAKLFDGTYWTGTSRSSRCSDNQFVQQGWNDRAQSLRVERVHNAPCYGMSGAMPISNVRGSVNYVEATLTSSWQPQKLQVRVWTPSTEAWTGWYAMTKQTTTSVWTANPPTPSGSTVQVRAVVGVGNGVDLSPCYKWIPGASGTPTQAYCPEPFKATFTDVRGNAWWLQASLASNDHVDAVEYRVACTQPYEPWTAWKPMQDQGWGWTASPGTAIAAGTKIDFRARGDRTGEITGDAGGGAYGPWTSSEYDVSRGYSWPGGTTTVVASQTTACFF